MNFLKTSSSRLRAKWDPIYTPFLPQEVNALVQMEAGGSLIGPVVGNWTHPEDPMERIRLHNFWDVLTLTLVNSPCTTSRAEWEETVGDFLDWLSFSFDQASENDSSLGAAYLSSASETITALLTSLSWAAHPQEHLEEPVRRAVRTTARRAAARSRRVRRPTRRSLRHR